ncbi:hypothetical protein pb186bvf_011878 [Paramecium bursaria]
MDEEIQKKGLYSINLEIDKIIYENRDQIKGYLQFYGNENIKMNSQIEYRLQLQGRYQYRDQKNRLQENIFILKENQINQQEFSFLYNLDLITTTSFVQCDFSINYYIYAIILAQNSKKCEKFQSFMVYRPYVNIERPIYKDIKTQVNNIFCCKYGEIYIRASLQKRDFQINDIAYIQIEIDSSLSSKNVDSIQANLISKTFYYDSRNKQFKNIVFNGVKFNAIQTKKLQTILELKIMCYDEQKSDHFHQSFECLFVSHCYFIQIILNTGIFNESIELEIPIIIYHTSEQHIQIYTNPEDVNDLQVQFDQQTYNHLKNTKFIEINVCQDQWDRQQIDFPELQYKNDPEIINNMITIKQVNK